MKTIPQTFLTVLIIVFTSSTYAQKSIKDSLLVNIDNNIELRMSIYNYSDLKETVTEDLLQLQDILKKSRDEVQNSPYTISYSPNEKISITYSKPTENIIWKNPENQMYKYTNVCSIQTSKYVVEIVFNELDYLLSDNLASKVGEAIEKTMADQTRFTTRFNYNFEKDSLVSTKKNVGNTNDFLSLKSGVGANFIKNQPVVDLSFELGFTFSQKGISKNKYYTSYNMLYDFVENSSVKINGFLNLGYQHNFSNNKDQDDWLGFEFGYLVSRHGELFDENTFRLGLNWEAGNSITISPQLYISKENTFPGLRIGFGF